MSERITYEGQYQDAWVCICGNTPHSEGFYPCLPSGEQVEPVKAGPWDGVLYVCDRCGRIINQHTLEVVGVTSEEVAEKKNAETLRSATSAEGSSYE